MTDTEPGRRVVVREVAPDPLEAIARRVELVAQEPPGPAELGPEDVVVAVRSAAVGWVDLLMMADQYQHLATPPWTPGLEYAGVVTRIGAGAAGRVAVGGRVLADPFRTGPRSKGEYRRWGGFASWAVAPVDGLLPLPEGLGFDQAACLLGGAETATHCLLTRGRLEAGEAVLIHGASGSTGSAAVGVAKRLGATVIATGRSAEKLEAVRTAGADHVVRTVDDAGAPRRFRDDVKAATGGRGVDVVYDPVGGETSLESLRCVRFGARYLVVGWAATPFAAGGKGRAEGAPANVLPTNLIMMKGLDVLGCPTAIATHADPALRSARLERVLGWVADGYRPLVGATYALDDVAEALRAKWRSAHVGNVVVRPPAAG